MPLRPRLVTYARDRLTTHLVWLVVVLNAAYLIYAVVRFIIWLNYPRAYRAAQEIGSGFGLWSLLWCAFAALVFYLHRRVLAARGGGRESVAYAAVIGAILVCLLDPALEAWRASGSDLTPLLYVALLILLYLLLWHLPQKQLAPWKEKLEPKDYLTIANSNRTLLLQLVGGVVLLAGLYYTAQNMSIAQENVRLTLVKQESERLSQAISQLKDDRLEVRLVALYNLRTIARASSDNYYLITGVLAKYVSGRAAWKPAETPPAPPEAETPPDIQAVLSFLSDPYPISELIRKESSGSGERVAARLIFPRNFSGLDLRGVALNQGHMTQWSFKGTHLEGADLRGGALLVANLDGADLSSADLSSANLTQASLRNAILNATKLGGAVLEGADLEGADLSYAVGLTAAMIRRAKNYDKAKLPPAIQSELAGGAP